MKKLEEFIARAKDKWPGWAIILAVLAVHGLMTMVAIAYAESLLRGVTTLVEAAILLPLLMLVIDRLAMGNKHDPAATTAVTARPAPAP